MVTYTHELPAAAQQQGVTHVQVRRTIIEPSYIHATVQYGTMEDGAFVDDSLVGQHKLVVNDMGAFADAPSGLDTLPSTKGETLEAAAAGLCEYADSQDLWHTLQ